MTTKLASFLSSLDEESRKTWMGLASIVMDEEWEIADRPIVSGFFPTVVSGSEITKGGSIAPESQEKLESDVSTFGFGKVL